MLLIDFIEYVKSDDYEVKSQKDFILLNKYFNDLDINTKDKISKMCIKYWCKKKIKIINPEELNILAYYVDMNFGYDKNIKKDDESIIGNDDDESEGLSIFPFNSSDVKSSLSVKNYRMLRRKI